MVWDLFHRRQYQWAVECISCFLSNFSKTFISLMKHRKCKVCLPFWVILSLNGCRSNCFTFLTGGYAFIRLVGVLERDGNVFLKIATVNLSLSGTGGYAFIRLVGVLERDGDVFLKIATVNLSLSGTLKVELAQDIIILNISVKLH